MGKRKISIHLLPALIFFVLSMVLSGVIGIWPFKTTDVNVHDTYLVIDGLYIFVWIFFLPLYFFYLVWYLLKKGSSTVLLKILIISNFILIVGFPIIELLIEFIVLTFHDKSDFGSDGWTIYPPLSGVPEGHQIAGETRFQFWLTIVIRTFLVLTFGFSVFMLGKKEYGK